MGCDYAKISELIGQIFRSVTSGRDEIHFLRDDGTGFRFFHDQDCCESVVVEDISGDLGDLEGEPILVAEESSNSGDENKVPGQYYESVTWTFYRFTTIKGSVVVRWCGESNGYYSESVEIGYIGEPKGERG